MSFKASVSQIAFILCAALDSMASPPGNSWAVTLTAFFIRCCGFWAEDTKCGKKVMDWIVTYSIVAVLFALCVTCNDLYHCYGDFDVSYLYTPIGRFRIRFLKEISKRFTPYYRFCPSGKIPILHFTFWSINVY